VHEAKVEANPGSQYIFVIILKHRSFDMSTRKVELFYYPVFKGLKVLTNEELQRRIVIYFIHHPELKSQTSEPWYCSKVSPGFNHEAVECYFIVSPQPLKEQESSDGTVRHSSIVLYNLLKRGTLLCQTWKIYPKALSWCEETDCISPSRLHVIDLSPIFWRIIYSLLFYISIGTIQISFIVPLPRENVYKNPNPSSGKPCFILIMGSLCKNV